MPTVEVIKVYADGTGHYSALKTAIDANRQDLVVADKCLVFELKGSINHTGSYIELSAYTTSSNCNITIRPVDGDEAKSTPGSATSYSSNTYFLVCRDKHVNIHNLEITGSALEAHSASNTTFHSCLIYDFKSSITSSIGAYFYNCIMFDCGVSNDVGGNGIYIKRGALHRCTLIASTEYGGYNGQIITRYSDGVITQTIIVNETLGGYENFFQCTNANNDYNADNEGEAPGENNFTASLNDFEDPASNNYNLKNTSPLFTAGPSGEPIGAILPSNTISNDFSGTASLAANTTLGTTGSKESTDKVTVTSLATVSAIGNKSTQSECVLSPISTFLMVGKKEVHGKSIINQSTSLNTVGAKSSFGSLSISATLTITLDGTVSEIINRQGSASINALAQITNQGAKSTQGDIGIHPVSNLTLSGKKQAKNVVNISQTCTVFSQGTKSASGGSQITSISSFSVSGTASNIISKSGRISLALSSNVTSSGIKSIGNTVGLQINNTLSTKGYKDNSGDIVLFINSVITVSSDSEHHTPLIRSISIEGLILDLRIPSQIHNKIVIEGEF